MTLPDSNGASPDASEDIIAPFWHYTAKSGIMNPTCTNLASSDDTVSQFGLIVPTHTNSDATENIVPWLSTRILEGEPAAFMFGY